MPTKEQILEDINEQIINASNPNTISPTIVGDILSDITESGIKTKLSEFENDLIPPPVEIPTFQEIIDNSSTAYNIKTPFVLQTENGSDAKGAISLTNQGPIIAGQDGGVTINGDNGGVTINVSNKGLFTGGPISFNNASTNFNSSGGITLGQEEDPDRFRLMGISEQDYKGRIYGGLELNGALRVNGSVEINNDIRVSSDVKLPGIAGGSIDIHGNVLFVEDGSGRIVRINKNEFVGIPFSGTGNRYITGNLVFNREETESLSIKGLGITPEEFSKLEFLERGLLLSSEKEEVRSYLVIGYDYINIESTELGFKGLVGDRVFDKGNDPLAYAQLGDMNKPVSLTQPGIVDNTLLQELGGEDKTINGIRIGMGNNNIGNNQVFGAFGLDSITTGNFNLAVGSYAMAATTTGEKNTALGTFSMYANISGNRNTGVGIYSCYGVTTGNSNTGVGQQAVQKVTTGHRNVGMGDNSLANAITASDNTAFGHYSGNAITGERNTIIGSSGGPSGGISSGSNNLIIAPNNGIITGILSGSGNVIVGKVTGLPAASTNIIILSDGVGNIALRKDTDGTVTLPNQTIELITAGTGKEIVTKEYLNLATPYKSYAALVTQLGVNPVSTAVMNNTIGSIVWTKISTGSYIGTLAGAFPSTKTLCFFQQSISTDGDSYTFEFSRGSNDTIKMLTRSNGVLVDDIFVGQIEIKVYN